MTAPHRGELFILSAPSGTGKTTLIRSLLRGGLKSTGGIVFSVSHTTREPRPGEDARGVVLYVHGFTDYFFQAELADFCRQGCIFREQFESESNVAVRLQRLRISFGEIMAIQIFSFVVCVVL